ncbi:MAG: PUA domain-containing protein [Candidatus Thorarchaeota archaeon]
MKPELVDPMVWNEIQADIDRDFGAGVTKSLLDNLVPITIGDKEGKSFYLMPAQWTGLISEDLEDFDIRLVGLWVGTLKKGKLRLSLPILSKLAGVTENIIVVSKQGAELFTYGRSILKEGVVSLKPSLKRGQRVIVQDERGNVIGLAMLVVDGFMKNRIGREKLVAKNLIDIGWYIRRMG